MSLLKNDVMHRIFTHMKRDKSMAVGLLGVCFVLLVGVFGPAIVPYAPQDFSGMPFMQPNMQHWLGTDNLGRDILSQLIVGTRLTILLAFGATGISLLIGILLGAIAGYYGETVDSVLSWVSQITLTIPRLFLAMLLIALFGTDMWVTILVISFTIWPSNARLMRAQVLSLKNRPFVQASKIAGVSSMKILFSHIIPNGIGAVIANTSLLMAQAILLEASLSFLGLGDVERTTWGQIIHTGKTYMRTAWWTVVFPGVALIVLLLSLHLVGDGIARILNPRLRMLRPVGKSGREPGSS